MQKTKVNLTTYLNGFFMNSISYILLYLSNKSKFFLFKKRPAFADLNDISF